MIAFKFVDDTLCSCVGYIRESTFEVPMLEILPIHVFIPDHPIIACLALCLQSSAKASAFIAPSACSEEVAGSRSLDTTNTWQEESVAEASAMSVGPCVTSQRGNFQN